MDCKLLYGNRTAIYTVFINPLQRLICGNVLGIYILLNLIYKLLPPSPSRLGSQSYSGVIGAFINILKYILYSVVSYVRLYVNIRVIKCYVSTTIYIALARLYKGRAVPQALIQRLIIISNYSLILEGVREQKFIFFIIYIGRKGIIGTIRAVQHIISNNIMQKRLYY